MFEIFSSRTRFALRNSLNKNGNFKYKRSIHIAHEKFSDCGSFIYEMKNDRKEGENLQDYQKRSWEEISAMTSPNSLHIYVYRSKVDFDKKDLVKYVAYPGHITSFLSDEKGKIIEESFVSLRPGKPIDERKLKFKLDHLAQDYWQTREVYEVKFSSSVEELNRNFFRQSSEGMNPAKDVSRFIIGVPIYKVYENCKDQNIQDIKNKFIDNVISLKEEYNGRYYILCDGYVDREYVKSLNCVTGFYESVDVIGSEANPSPQMAAASYLNLILGDKTKTDVLIDGSSLLIHGERTFDLNLRRR